jgi:hypothetical protein
VAVPPELEILLAPYDDELAETTLSLHDRVHAVLPRCHRIVWDAANAKTVTFTPTTRWQDAPCNIATYRRHVNLVFPQGTGLADEERVLEGTGVRTRHVTFRSPTEVEAARWIEAYVREAVGLLGMTTADGDGGVTVRRTAGR